MPHDHTQSGSVLLRKSLHQIRQETVAQIGADHLATYQRIVQRVHDVDIRSGALQAGATAPAFLLPDSEGRLVSGQELLTHGSLVVRFCCGGWCPFCCAELRQFELVLPEIHDLGGELVVITPDTGQYPRAMKRDHGLNELQVLSDIDLGVSLSFGVTYSVPLDLRGFFSTSGYDLTSRHGSERWMLPVPASFVIAPNAEILDAHVEPEILARHDAGDIIALLARSASQFSL